MRLYIIALQFLTIIPVPSSVRCEGSDLGRSMALFPLVGLTLGALLAGADLLMGAVLPRQVTALLLVVLLAVVTGALHLDGLADVCDGLAARGGRERFLEVMKDSRTGAVGVVGVALVLLLKYETLAHLVDTTRRETLFLFPMLARYGQVLMTVGSRGARGDGLGALFAAGAGWKQLSVAACIAVGGAVLLLGPAGVYCCIAVSAFTWMVRAWAHRRLGGITGDVIGCASEVNEVLCLLTVLATTAKGNV